ncbi:MAG TPA: hypothetical protein VJ453_00735 [Terriglobales bacterium]|nr:hypothetical protein [Terriglobales bacterium]
MPEKLTPEIVTIEVQRFWKAFQERNGDALTDLYSPEAMVFSSSNSRPEPGRLASARRQREYFQPQTTIKVALGEILLLGDSAAVCGYNFDFEAHHVATGLGSNGEEHIHQGRVTQVFSYNTEGQLRVVHEHLRCAEVSCRAAPSCSVAGVSYLYLTV